MNRTRLFKQPSGERHNERKAISPIIATLLLILIAIAAGVVVYAYVLGFVGNSTGGQPSGTSDLSIDTASGVSSSGSVTAYVRNVGGTSATISSFYILDSTGTIVSGGSFIGTASTPYATCPSSGAGVSAASQIPCTLAPQSTLLIKVTSGVAMSSSNSYTIKVTTTDGSVFTYTFRAS
jgi:flagellin-like protein